MSANANRTAQPGNLTRTRTTRRARVDPVLPTQDEIRRRAHEIFLRRNGKPGNAVLDWLEAEYELRAARKTAVSPA